jgi:hypothetical protein
MTTQSGFEEGIRFAVKALREVAIELGSEVYIAMRDLADKLEAQASDADAPKVLVLPLVWNKTPLSQNTLEVGCLVGGTAYLDVDGIWFARSYLSAEEPTKHPTLEAAKAALEEAVMNLGEQS